MKKEIIKCRMKKRTNEDIFERETEKRRMKKRMRREMRNGRNDKGR